MSDKLEVVKGYADAAGKDLDLALSFLSEDFQNIDREGNVVATKETWATGARMLLAAFPDLIWVTTDIREEGGFVILSGHNEGTHLHDLDLTVMGVGVVPPSGERVVWPEASMRLTVEGGKITQMTPHGGAAGLPGFLRALGIEPPSG